ncbi:hypothetical protein G6514_000447 [Epicoccum nigrum]|nr:hypothetical protein G6514_000447 [Epicoccum nigrum]
MSSLLPKKILIFGATGVIGKYIIREIVNGRSSFEKIGLFTSPLTAETKSSELDVWRGAGVEVIVGDVTSEADIKEAYKGYDTVVSALGRGAIRVQIPLLQLAEASDSITSFFPSEYGTDIEYGPASASEKPHQDKLCVRKFIRENVKKLHVTYLVTGPYSDLFLAPSSDARIGSFDPRQRAATLLGAGDEAISFTTMRDVGRLVVAALRTPCSEGQKERVLKVNSFTASGTQALAVFEKATGKKWDVSYTSLEELKELEKKAWEEEWPVRTPLTLRRIWIEGGTLYEKRDNGKIVGGEEGLETLEDQVKVVVERFG